MFEEALKYFRHFFSNARFSAASEPHSSFSDSSQGNSDVDSSRVVLSAGNLDGVDLIIPGLVVVVGRKGRALTL